MNNHIIDLQNIVSVITSGFLLYSAYIFLLNDNGAFPGMIGNFIFILSMLLLGYGIILLLKCTEKLNCSLKQIFINYFVFILMFIFFIFILQKIQNTHLYFNKIPKHENLFDGIQEDFQLLILTILFAFAILYSYKKPRFVLIILNQFE